MSLSIDERLEARIPHGCLVKARSLYPALKRAERGALVYLLGHPDDVRSVSIAVIARGAGCGLATLSRLARRLGYAGYPELKAAFRAQAGGTAGVVYRGISAQDSPEAVLEKVFAASMESLRDTLAVLDRAQYARAVEAVRRARRLLFCGLGDASQVAAAICQKFLRAGIDAHAAEDPDTQMMLAAHLEPGDTAVGISHSGRSVPVMNALAEAHGRGATTIAITNYPRSPLARRAEVVLLTADFAEDLNGEVVSKRISEHCILESLYITRLIGAQESLSEALERARQAVTVYKAQPPRAAGARGAG